MYSLCYYGFFSAHLIFVHRCEEQMGEQLMGKEADCSEEESCLE